LKASSLIDEWLPLFRIVQHVTPATLTDSVSPLVILAVLHEVLTKRDDRYTEMLGKGLASKSAPANARAEA